jgi:hypothetical protein
MGPSPNDDSTRPKSDSNDFDGRIEDSQNAKKTEQIDTSLISYLIQQAESLQFIVRHSE